MNLSLIFLVLQILLFACTFTINVLAIDLLCPLVCIHTIGIAVAEIRCSSYACMLQVSDQTMAVDVGLQYHVIREGLLARRGAGGG